MLKKQNAPTSNNSYNVVMIISGAKKRRAMAKSAVQAVSCNKTARGAFVTVK